MNLSRIVVAIVLNAVCAAAYAAAGPQFKEEVAKQLDIYQSRGENTPEGYVTGRGLLGYSYLLSGAFVRSLAELGPGDRWLDIGAGEGRAILDYSTAKYEALYAGSQPPSAQKAKAVAVSIEDRRTDLWRRTAANLDSDQVKYLYGRRLREYSQDELGGRFKMITDVLGAFSYTRVPAVFMQKALGLLETNGSLYTVLQDVHWADGTNKPYYPDSRFLTQIAKGDGAEMKVCEWLQSISCVQVTCETKADIKPPIEVYRVQKVCEDVKVPGLSLVHFESGTPPERGFRLADPPSAIVQGGAAR